MKLGIVVGQVVATQKNERLVGHKLLIVKPIDEKGVKKGDTIVAVDTVGAGVGETILYSQGTVASRAMCDANAPVDIAIIAIVDNIDCYK